MIQRISEALNIQDQAAPTAQQSGMGMKRPDVQLESHEHDRVQQADSSTERILGSIMAVVGDFGQKVFKASTEEAYLQGVAKAGTIANENELETNPITSDWTRAGYRDTMGRLSAADLESKRVTEMSKWREKTPEEYQANIAKQRGELLPQLEGMSRAQRQSQLAQAMLSERSAIKLHGTEHAKWIWETQEKAIKAQALSTFQTLDVAKSGTPETYQYETQAAHGKVFSSIVQNGRLTDAQKATALEDVARAALERDHQGLYDQIMKSEVPFPDGSVRPMRSLFSFDQESKLQGEYRTSMARTAGMRLQKWVDDTASVEAEWRNPESTNFPSLDQVRQIAAEGVQNGYFKTPESQNAFMQSYYEHARKRDAKVGLASAYANGDQGYFLRTGNTRDDGLKAWIGENAKKMPLPELATALVSNGVKTGQSESFKALGSLMSPMVAQLGSVNQVNAENAGTVYGILRSIDKMEGEQQIAAMHHLMSGLPENQQATISLVRERMRQGDNAQGAVAFALQTQIDAGKLSPQTRKEMSQAASKEDAKAIASLEPKSWLGNLWTTTKALLGNESARNELAITAPESVLPWKDATPGAVNNNYRAQLELGEAVKRIREQRPELASASVADMAKAEVAKRAVPTAHGPLILPHGSTIEQTFGINTADPERVGKAIDALYPATPGGSTSITIDPQGRLKADFYNEAGLRTKPAEFIDTKAVGDKVRLQRDAAIKDYKWKNGEGITVDANGLEVPEGGATKGNLTYNGANTAGVPNEQMFALRQRLVEHEGVKDKPYKDLSGKVVNGKPVMTVGAGISSTNDFYPPIQPDGTIRKEDMDNSFKLASNQAAQIGMKVTAATGVKGPEAFMLFSELAYQSGVGGLQNKAFNSMVKAIQSKDPAAAQAALEQHPVWQYNGMNTKRGQHYSALVRQLATPRG